METLNIGWEIPVVLALTAMILFFAGCLFMFGLYCTVISCIGKFPLRAVFLFWTLVLTSAFVGSTLGLEAGIVTYTASSPIIGMVFWYYERKHRRITGESEIIVMA